jgi:hypothetical protein
LENHPVEVALFSDVGLDKGVTGVIVLKLRQVPVADLKQKRNRIKIKQDHQLIYDLSVKIGLANNLEDEVKVLD